MLRRLDAGNIIAHHADGAREFLLGEPFCFAQLSNRSPYRAGCFCSTGTSAKISVRGFASWSTRSQGIL